MEFLEKLKKINVDKVLIYSAWYLVGIQLRTTNNKDLTVFLCTEVKCPLLNIYFPYTCIN